MSNTISYKELKDWYLHDENAIQLADMLFGDKQPNIYRTGFYSAPSWNWAYLIGLVKVGDTVYEVVTQFGTVKAARVAYIPEMDRVK